MKVSLTGLSRVFNRYLGLTILIILLGALAGIAFQKALAPHVLGVFSDFKSFVMALNNNNVLLFSFIFGKNLFVACLVVFPMNILLYVNEKQAFLGRKLHIDTRLPVYYRMLNRSESAISFLAILIGIAILVINGSCLALTVIAFLGLGMHPAYLAAGLIPHGIPELFALCLACSEGMFNKNFRSKILVFATIIIPLFAIAAATETWITPIIMHMAQG